MKTKPEIRVRLAILDILNEVLEQRRSLTNVLPNHLSTFQDPRDKALIQYCCYGILRDYLRLTAIIKKLVTKPLKEQNAHYLLLIGIYQLMNMRMPPFAIVHSTVDTAKALKLFSVTGLINGVLRSFQRQQESLLTEIDKNPITLYSHPAWLIELLQQAWPKQWQAICAANNQHPPLWLRINQQKITTDAYVELLNKNNINIKHIQNEACCLESPMDINELPGFSEGFVSVQDGAAQLAATLLDLQPHQRILDACAAPGGKTCHILEKENTAQVIALDKDEQRLEKIQENLQRLDLRAIVTQGDALTPDQWWDGKLFDRILIDAPCSATGVIRRHPDIKILRQPEDITTLAKQQGEFLKVLWPLLKPHGKLVYAICSILPQEGDHIMTQFCANHPDACVKYSQQFFPGQEDKDGFFYAVLEKDQN